MPVKEHIRLELVRRLRREASLRVFLVNDRTPILQVLDGFENKDALMHETFKKKAKNLRAARDEEHQSQDNLFKVYVERAWPECSVIVGKPPFIGNKKMRGELDRMNGEGYTEAVWEIYGDRLPATSDLC